MNKELIIQMAREAGFRPDPGLGVFHKCDGGHLERFAALVAAAAKAEEREQLLKLSTKAHDVDGHCDIVLSADIRARGETK